jgi:hypothetical protein
MTQKFSVQLEIHSPSLAEKMKRIISPLDGFYLDPSKLLEPGDFLIFEMGENLREYMHILHTINSSGRAKEIWIIPNNYSAVTEAANQRKTPIDF